jgi:hypothetical protein
MKNKNLIIFISIFFSLNCNGQINSSTQNPLASKIDNLFYCVYELSSKTTAVVVNFSETETQTVFDSIFMKVSLTDSLSYSLQSPKNCYFFDTTGEYRLLRSARLEKEMLKHFDKELNIYGTKGFTKAKIKTVLFGLNECSTNIFAFCIDNVDTLKIGHPLISSRQFFKLNYSSQSETFDRKIQEFYSGEKSDYSDSIKTKVFATLDTLLFTYNDDFQWGKNPNLSNCTFPYRTVFINKKNSPLMRYWSDGLDLFGIPCD